MMTSEKKRKFENGEYPQKTNVKTPKIPGQKFYAVHRGRQPGIYHTWPECQAQILGYTGAIYKKFDSQAEAEDFVKNGWRAKGLKPKIKEQIKAPPVPVEEDESDYTIVYTDGSSRGNGKDHCRAGVGVYFGEKDPRNVSERLLGKQTNQRAEVTAAIRAIEKVGDDKQPLEIRTDSQYLIKGI
ncbi:hypothetical protein K7432_018649 [Basidiobolus ranarum]|uniref:ribonuclease H n=1 Tax=Basidiobolus ranarum TaxID=34480 RepID=A0ABR2WKF2_9FUNG